LPLKDSIRYDENNSSIVFKLNYKKFDMLFTGDIGKEREEYILNNLMNENILSSEILKVGHHGSRYSSTDKFLDKVSPNISIISTGRDNPYNHPHEDTLERIDNYSSLILRTDLLESIKIFTNGNSIQIY